MKGEVAGLERRPLRTVDLAQGVLERLRREMRIEPRQGVPEALLQDNLAVVGAFGQALAPGYLSAVPDLPAKGLKQSEGGGFYGGFGEGNHGASLAFTLRLRQISSMLSLFRASSMASIAFGEYLLNVALPIRISL
ncbi:MAG: hypothetical protein KatS3mg076_1836 [Candidatus Binatia bacterium]|nr:MAG: hypothetical protein KatS3mg076_1836 [Candidatus Binatia bacterium]